MGFGNKGKIAAAAALGNVGSISRTFKYCRQGNNKF